MTMNIDVAERSARAEGLFREGYNCAQAVYMAYADLFDMDPELAATISASFGGGMGRMREVCGACSGMFLLASHAIPANDPKNKEAKAANYKLVQDMAGDFQSEMGSIICRELLGLNKKGDEPLPEERTEAYYKKRPCAEIVRHAAQVAGERLQTVIKE